MKLLIAFGTTEGQTRKIAERIAARLQGKGHQAELYDTDRRPRDKHVGDFDAIVVAASVHQRVHQDSIKDFVTAHLPQLQSRPSAFISVSLSSAFPDGQSEAQGYIDDFLASANWQPKHCLKAAGALRYSEYDYFKEQIIKHVVLKGRSDDIHTGRDHEFTDWALIKQFIDQFVLR